MKRTNTSGPKGPSDKNPIKGKHVTDETARKSPTDFLTEQRQSADAAPNTQERDVGQFSGRGKAPLQKK